LQSARLPQVRAWVDFRAADRDDGGFARAKTRRQFKVIRNGPEMNEDQPAMNKWWLAAILAAAAIAMYVSIFLKVGGS
jgi:hypothetical protein